MDESDPLEKIGMREKFMREDSVRRKTDGHL